MRKLLIFGVLVASVVGVIAMTSMRPEPPKKERVELDPLVVVQVLESMNAKFEIRSQGTVRPRTETILSAEVSGTITSILPKFVAGTARFRAIVLTSFTTAAGLMPIMLETDPLYLLQEDGFAWMSHFKARLFGRPATDKTSA